MEEYDRGVHHDGLSRISLTLLLHSAKNSSGAEYGPLTVAKKLTLEYSKLRFPKTGSTLGPSGTLGFTPQMIWSL
jgi:hypothetical protein